MKFGLIFLISVGTTFMAVAPSSLLSAESVNPRKLQALLKRASETSTDSLLIMKNGKLVHESYSSGVSKKIQTHSATKSLINLGIGFLIRDRFLDSLQVPIHNVFPEWQDWSSGPKAKITIAHLMSHTSGLAEEGLPGDEDDIVLAAHRAPIANEPGSAFVYSDKATDLLSGVIEKLSGLAADKYIDKNLLAPLGITDYEWDHDKAGHAFASMGLHAHARDLAKIGLMLQNSGTWEGQKIVDPKWIELSTKPSQSINPACGLLWWLIGPRGISGFDAGGYMGQYLVIAPKDSVIGVRLHEERAGDDEERVGFFDFPDLVTSLSH